jgi:hypothetical protein
LKQEEATVAKVAPAADVKASPDVKPAAPEKNKK